VPHDIPDDEILIRAVTTWHLRNGKLQGGLFRHPADEVSVSRRRWIPPWLAKFIAKARVENSQLSPPKLYTGLAFVSAAIIRSKGSAIVDSRSEYLGHADVQNRIASQQVGEALPAEVAKIINKRAKDIADAAAYVPDPKPRSLAWHGDR
jgi:hypothetical protein